MPKRRSSDQQFINLKHEVNLEKLQDSIKAEFMDFPDSRRGGNIIYPAWYLMLVILCGYLAGGNTIADIAHFAELRAKWFFEITGVNCQAPSYDTIWWFLVKTKPAVFKQLISRWLKKMPSFLQNQLLVIDGKRLRGVSSNEHITHIVELFATEGRLVIAQEKVPNKAGERTALPGLLDTVDVAGTVISMDALYAHVADIKEILDRGADYIIGIKGNQPTLNAEVKNFFDQANEVGFEGVSMTQFKTFDKGHGRIENRTVTVTNDLEWLPQQNDWHMESLIEVRSSRKIGSVVQESIRYYASSRKESAEQFTRWIRDHWDIENGLHYIMDVVFREDASLSDCGNSAENMSLIRRLALNTIRVFDSKRAIADARRCATHEPEYLRGLLAKLFC